MMKKIFVLVALLITAFSISAQDMLEAMLTDSDETTNIRSTPGGNVVMKLNSGKDDSMKAYVFMLTSPQNGWWKIDDLWNAADDEALTLASTGSIIRFLASIPGIMAGRNSICAKHPMKRPTSFSPLTRN